MASNAVTITFAGDSKSLERTFDKVGEGAKGMARDIEQADGKARSFSGTMEGVGGSVGNAEGKFMGAADLLDGLGGAFGLPTEQATGLFRAFGDLSGGFEGVSGLFTTGIGTLGTLATKIGLTSAATSVWTGIQTAFNAVMALNPAVLITAAIIALGVAIVIAYQKSETFRDIVKGAFDTVRGAAEAVWGFISSLPDKIGGIAGAIRDALMAPFKAAFSAIAKAWNNTVGRLSFSVPDWVPGLGGKGFTMPQLQEFHTGGVVPGSPGQAVPIMAMAGETVIPAGASSGGTLIIHAGAIVTETQLADLIQKVLLRKQARTGSLGFV